MSQIAKVTQFVADLADGDAISTDCIQIHNILKSWGYQSVIYADRVQCQEAYQGHQFKEHRLENGEIVILHYSLWSASAEYVLRLRPSRLVMIYHNITPPHYFQGLNAQAEEVTIKGRQALGRFAPLTNLALGDSEFNRAELERMGFSRTGILPIAVDFQKLRDAQNIEVLHRFQDGYVNLLSVGRIVPNKRLEDVIKLFYHYKRRINPRSRLFLVGPADMGIPYLRWLESLVEYLGLDPHVYFPGRVAHDDLLAYYHLAQAYICLSEHEGFCAPLVESMYLGIPVLAFASTAVPETLGDAGALFRRKDFPAMAELLHLVTEDAALRKKMIAKGTQRALAFSRERVAEALRNYLESVD